MIHGVRGVVVRFDGVLIDSCHAAYAAWQHEFVREGLHLPIDYWGDLFDRHPGPGCDEQLLRLLRQRVADPDQIRDDHLDRVHRRRRRIESALRLRPGVVAWLREASDRGVRMFTVSDQAAGSLTRELDRLGVGRFFERVLSFGAGGAEEFYRDAPRQADIDRSELVAMEDTGHGVRAARAAGLRCIASPQRASVHALPSAEPGTVIAEPPWMSLSDALGALAGSRRAVPRPAAGTDTGARVSASLGALALGDALGKMVNKRSLHQLEPDTVNALSLLETGGEPPADCVFTGCVTDDTVLLLALVDSVVDDGRVSRDAYERVLRSLNPRGGRQIYQLKSDASDLFVALDGNTNGCVPRCAAVAYTTPSTNLGDLCYDALKVATLTHGGHEALFTALLFAVIAAAAVDGEPVQSVRERLPGLYRPLTRLAGGGADVADLVQGSLDRLDRIDSPHVYLDVLEGAVGMAMAARSSVVSAICLGLSGFSFPVTLAALMRRQAHWDLDSTAAVYAGLAGAFQPSEVPALWVGRIERHSGRDFGKLAASLVEMRRAPVVPA
ncbi:ADP-ribosylglycohydrolase family protein [Micromonospora sp. RP3T]|uniref:ADP-ribosylglycohydrolase family protein n=1 Tax=Micromonospora sp. RP3T TaxID=2135446 RepID=UPI003D7448CD